MDKKKNISVVIPCFNEEESLVELMVWIDKVLKSSHVKYEIFFVDDGSTDNTWDVIKNIAKEYHNIKAIKFNRNYGKSAALQTAFQHTQGDVVFTMDADLQDSPDEILPMYNMIVNDGYDIVSGWKKNRHDPLDKTIPSKLFNLVIAKVSKIKLHDFNCGLKAYKYKVIKNICLYGDMHRYIPLLAKWNGYDNIGEKIVQHYPRKYGKSKYGFSRMITGFLDFLSITFIMKYKKHPMHLFGTLGALTFVLGFISFGVLVFDKLYTNLVLNTYLARPVTEKWYFYATLVCILAGIQLFLAGFIGEILANQHQSKNKKNEGYIVDENINND